MNALMFNPCQILYFCVNSMWITVLHCVQKKTATNNFFHISMNYV